MWSLASRTSRLAMSRARSAWRSASSAPMMRSRAARMLGSVVSWWRRDRRVERRRGGLADVEAVLMLLTLLASTDRRCRLKKPPPSRPVGLVLCAAIGAGAGADVRRAVGTGETERLRPKRPRRSWRTGSWTTTSSLGGSWREKRGIFCGDFFIGRAPNQTNMASRSRSPVSDRGSRANRNRRSPSRGRSRTPSHSRSPSPRRNGRSRGADSRSRSRSRSRTRSRTRTRSPSPGRSHSRGRDVRMRSRTRSVSASPAPRSTKIVIERLTKNVTEDHLRDIFGQYGEIRDLDLPINRQGTNRGTAYILYVQEPDAESAIAHMHEGQIDGATVNVSIVLPRRKFSPEPPGARRGNPHIDPRHIAQAARVGGLASAAAAGGSSGFRGSRGRGGGGPPAGPRGGRNNDVYRPSSRSKSPDAGRAGGYRSRSPGSPYSNRSDSRSRRRGGGGGRRDTGGDDYGRRRSPSRDSYSSYGGRRSRSRSQSRGRGGRSYR
ncbi:uncharacterized protein PpBr36_09860 [Pyricularia pennisetigena]|uniref:uncharacterized protein n=1 Tax=Pyricularia pennisetigena TaxID=1578925 RepID=UPI001154DB4E|nr:uncharacterized protein PpBr36_09860 [Pyricularia pennisetigena]TLS22538.1 hypothetical protein PpBr36_09860 [Pyricularia pennisetigena]